MSGQKIVGSLSARKIAQQQATQQLEIDIQCLKSYELECQKGSMSTETFSRIMNKASVEAQAYSVNIKNGTGSTQIYAQNQKVLQSSMTQTSIVSKTASVGLNLFKAALNSIIFFAVIEGISLLVKGIDHLILTADEAEETANNLRSSMQTFFDDINTGNKVISSISDRFNELSKHVTKTGENIDLTEEEYSEFLDICNQVKDIMPELVTGYTSEGDAIITLKDNVDSLSESYKEAIRLKAAMFISDGDENGNTIESFFDDYKIFASGEGGLFAPSAGGAWNNKTTDYEDYYGYDGIHKWLSDVTDLGLEDLQTKIKDIVGSTQATYLYALLKENDLVLSEITSENFNQVHDILNNRLASLEKQMLTRVNNIQMSLRQMLYADKDYWDIDNKEALSAIDSLFTSVDDEFIKQNELFSQSTLQAFESNVVKLFQNESTQSSMVDLYAPPTDDESVAEYVNRIKTAIEAIQTYCTENGIKIPISLGDISTDTDDLATKYENAIQSANEKFKGEDLTSFFEENSINTQEEIDKWTKIANSCDTATEAKKRYLEIDVSDETPDLSITDTITQLNTQLKPALDSLKSAYQDIFTDDGFTLENVDVDMLNNVLKVMNEMKEAGLGIDTTGFENLARVLTNSSSTAEEIQGAFNSLADSILTNTGVLGSLNEETASVITTMLEQMGVTNAQEIVTVALTDKTNELALSKLYLAETGEDITNASENEVAAFIVEQIEAGNCGQALALLQLKKMLVNGTLLDTSTDINNVLALANAAGITSNALSQLASAKAFYDSAVASGNAGRIDSATAQLNSLNTQIQNDIANFKPEVKFDSNSGKSSASKAGKEAADAYLEAFNKELKELDDLKNQGKISEKEYLDALRLLYERYFKNIDKYAKEFADNQAKYLDGMASMYESVFSYISSAIGKRISALGNERDAQVDSLKAQQEAAEASYQAEIDGIDDAIKALEKKKDAIQDQIDAKQEEIDAIKKASEARQREIDLQKALYELERRQNQRNILQYSDEKGMSYVNDTSGLRDAREEARKAQEEIDIAKIENEIDLLEKAQDQIDDQIDSLNERKDAIESMIDASNAYFESQIEATEKYFNALIDSMEKQQSKWDELLELKNQAEMMALLEQLGITEEQILNDSGAAYEAFKDQYLSVLRDMYDGNDSILAQFDKLTGMDVSGMTGYIEATVEAFDGLSEGAKSLDDLSAKADGAKKSVEGLTNAISGTGSAKVNNTGITTTSQGKDGQVSSGGSLTDAIQDLPSVGHEEFDVSIQEILTVLDEFITSLEEKWQQVTDITTNALTGGSSGEGKEKSVPGGGTPGVIQKKGGEEKEGSSGGVVGILQQAVEQVNSLLNGEEESFMSSFNTLLEEDPTLSETWETISTIFSDACTSIIEDLTAVMTQIDAFIAKCGELETGGEGNSLLSNFNFGFGKGYASGTRNAKQGVNLIGEDGTELYEDNDGNVGFATSPTLVGMEGGETVYNASETKDILKNSRDNGLLPHIRNYDAMMELFNNARLIPSFADNISKEYMNNINRNMNLIQNNQKMQTVTQHINVTMPNVTNSTSAEMIIKDIHMLSLKTPQYFDSRH